MLPLLLGVLDAGTEGGAEGAASAVEGSAVLTFRWCKLGWIFDHWLSFGLFWSLRLFSKLHVEVLNLPLRCGPRCREEWLVSIRLRALPLRVSLPRSLPTVQ